MSLGVGLERLFGGWSRTRRGSASELVARMRETYRRPDDVFKLECFDLDEAICVLELLTDAERRTSFVSWMSFAPQAPPSTETPSTNQ